MPEPDASAGPREGPPRPTAMVVFCGLLALQVAVPVARMASDAPTRFGWQMFATVRHQAGYAVRYADGVLDTVDVADHVVLARPEIDLPAVLPPHLCRQVSGAAAVLVHYPAAGAGGPERIEEYACR